jgi:beta-mannanase
VDAKLVPSCNVLWGAAAGGFSDTPRDQALREWEAKSGRTSTIYHTYHRGDEMFPTTAEIAMSREAGKPRVLFTNWKVGYGAKWADVPAGKQDARIDKLSAYIKANYTEKFFMALHHEPENDVNETAGSGMTAKDYAAMYRHTVLRMRANGVTNVVFVLAYMNVEKWNNSAWWYDLYPGDDVVDWLGVDTYVNAQPGGYHYGDFNYLMDRTTDSAKFPGWYTWASTQHPTKPIMVAEWGVYECKTACSPTEKAKLYDTVLPQLATKPGIKAMVYFDTASDQQGLDMRIDSTPTARAAFQKVAADPTFKVKL